MDKKTVFIKTPKGESEGANLSSDLRRIFSLIDNKSRADELAKRAPPSLRESWSELIGELVAGGYIVDKDKPATTGPKIATPKIAVPKFNPLKMFSHKEEPTDDLDFQNIAATPAPSAPDLAAKQRAAELEAKQKAEEAARARAELEAAVEAAKVRANAEAAAKAEAKARQEAELAARAKAVAEAKAKQEAMIREQVEAKARQEAAARHQAEQEAARAKAALEAAARAKAEAEAKVRAEIETAARAQQEAEKKAKREAEAARLQAEEAARAKAELEAIAKAKAEAEEILRKAREEAERVKAELEAARLRAEAEAKALAEARARQEAEEKARREAEEKARKEAEEKARREAEEKARREAEEKARREAEEKARREAEEKARKEAEERARREAEERARREAEEKARQEAEAARLKAEQEARERAEQEAAKAAAEARAAEERAKQEAETARLSAEQEAIRIRIEEETAARMRAESEAQAAAEARARLEAEMAAKREAEVAHSKPAVAAPHAEAPAFEIDLNSFLNKMESVQQQQHVAAEPKRTPETSAAVETVAAAAVEPDKVPEAEKTAPRDVAAEMMRLKEEAEAARRKAEEEQRRRIEEQALAEEQGRAWAEAEQRAKAQAQLEAEQAAQQAALAQAKAAQKPLPRARRKPLPWGKIVFGVLGLALVALLVLPYVYPLNDYVAPLEQELSAQLKQPVKIGKLSAASLPPKLELQGITIGKAQEVKIASAVLNLDLFSLFSDVKVISNAELQDINVDGLTIARQAATLKLLGAGQHYRLHHVGLQKVKFVTEELPLPVFSGIAELDDQGAFSRVSLHSPDDKLGFDLKPVQGHWQLGVNVRESALPILPDVVFSDLSAKGDLNEEEVNFTEVDGHIFNGILLGNAKLNWRKGWQLQGNFEAKLFELDKMFAKHSIDGGMYAEGSYVLSGAKLSQLKDAPHLEGSFNIKNGTISGFDMVETARLMSRENLVGGRTHFDELIGVVQLDNHTWSFRQLKIVSSMLSASGSFDILPGNQLTGTANAETKMRAGGSLLTLYGTATEPKLRAGR